VLDKLGLYILYTETKEYRPVHKIIFFIDLTEEISNLPENDGKPYQIARRMLLHTVPRIGETVSASSGSGLNFIVGRVLHELDYNVVEIFLTTNNPDYLIDLLDNGWIDTDPPGGQIISAIILIGTRTRKEPPDGSHSLPSWAAFVLPHF
jgi:hypothetical protein